MGTITGNGTAVTGLGGPAGYGETALPRMDQGYMQVDVSAVFEDGFYIGGTVYSGDELFISTDGFITFGTGVAVAPTDPASLTCPFIAVFMADVDTRIDGEGAESGQIWLDVDTVNDCVTITWDDVGFYRRNATETDTFQIQLYDRGGGSMDVVFRYEDIDWTSGDLQGGFGGTGGTPAFLGYRMDDTGRPVSLTASRNEPGQIALPVTQGNTGVAGLYVFRLGGAPGPIEGGAGNDILQGTAFNDIMHGLAGNDRLFGSAGADTMDGGTGWDTVDFGLSIGAVKVDLGNAALNTGWALGDSLIGIEAIIGTGKNDILRGGTLAEWLDGGAGHDNLDGRQGNDSLIGGDGNDTLLGSDGNDQLQGDAGNDSLTGDLGTYPGKDSLYGGLGNDTLRGMAGNDRLEAGDGGDSLYGGDGLDRIYGGSTKADLRDVIYGEGGNDTVYASYGNDRVDGGTGNDSLFGDSGIDDIYGQSGADSLYGGGDSDRLYGGTENDYLNGTLANDTLTGGTGADRFVHTGTLDQGSDWIMDFHNAESDRLVFGVTTARASSFTVALVEKSGAGQVGVKEMVITYKPTGQVIWTLVDGSLNDHIYVQVGSYTFDLLA